MPHESIIALATTPKSVTQAMEHDPAARPLDVAAQVFPEKPRTAKRSKALRVHTDDFPPEELDAAARCGRFPYRPSDLFLKVRRA